MSYFVWYCIDCKQEIEDLEVHDAQFPGHRYVEVIRTTETPVPTFIPDNVPTKEELQNPQAEISIVWDHVTNKPIKEFGSTFYSFDSKTEKWVSINRTTLVFSHRRTDSRRPVLAIGFAANALSGYYLNRASIITRVSATAYSKRSSSEGQLELGYLTPGTRNFQKVFTFTLTKNFTYEGTPWVELSSNILLQCRSHSRLYYPIVTVEIADVILQE